MSSTQLSYAIYDEENDVLEKKIILASRMIDNYLDQQEPMALYRKTVSVNVLYGLGYLPQPVTSVTSVQDSGGNDVSYEIDGRWIEVGSYGSRNTSVNLTAIMGWGMSENATIVSDPTFGTIINDVVPLGQVYGDLNALYVTIGYVDDKSKTQLSQLASSATLDFCDTECKLTLPSDLQQAAFTLANMLIVENDVSGFDIPDGLSFFENDITKVLLEPYYAKLRTDIC